MAKINIRDRNKNKPDKKPNWEYRFEIAKVGGKRQCISKAGFRTKREALEAGTQALAEYNYSGSHFSPKEISVSDYLDTWFKLYVIPNMKYNTQSAYRSIIENHLKPRFGAYRLNSLDPAVIQDYANGLAFKGFAKTQIKNILATFHGALNYAVLPLKYIKENPMQYVKLPKGGTPRKIRNVLSNEDFDMIIRRFPFGNRFHIGLMLGWYCGLRVSEAYGLTWDDIDFENKTVNVNKQILKRYFSIVPEDVKTNSHKDEKSGWFWGSPKYDSNRIIKIDDDFCGILRKEKERQELNEQRYGDYYTIYVAVTEKDEKGKPITHIVGTPKNLNPALPRVHLINIDENGEMTTTDSVKYLCRVVNYELKIKFSYHCLRHTHGTILSENGANIKAIQERLGHKDIETTLKTYIHGTEKMEDDTVEIFKAAASKKKT